MNKIEIKSMNETTAKVYIDGVEIKGLEKYILLDTLDSKEGRKQKLVLVIGDIKSLSVS